jgi:hypothetical protein
MRIARSLLDRERGQDLDDVVGSTPLRGEARRFVRVRAQTSRRRGVPTDRIALAGGTTKHVHDPRQQPDMPLGQIVEQRRVLLGFGGTVASKSRRETRAAGTICGMRGRERCAERRWRLQLAEPLIAVGTRRLAQAATRKAIGDDGPKVRCDLGAPVERSGDDHGCILPPTAGRRASERA